jgi:hypothetical protein
MMDADNFLFEPLAADSGTPGARRKKVLDALRPM